MAEGKKVFMLYVDQISIWEGMTDSEAGALIKHIYRYVNDQNPEPPDRITGLLFEPFKLQLKRDLVKWEDYRSKQSENGKKGGRPHKPSPEQEKPKNPSLILETQKSLKDTVKDKVTVKDIDIRPRDFLKAKNEIRLQEIHKNSGLAADEFEHCIEQWSLKVETSEYELNHKQLLAGLQKWTNTWVIKKREDSKKQFASQKPEPPKYKPL